MSKLFLPSLLLVAFNLCAQDNLDLENITSKKIISKFELVGGPGLLFNYGNNQYLKYRAFKLGYSLGLGVYHTFSKRFELNARILWERNGNKTKERVNANIGLDEVVESEARNDYITAIVALAYSLNRKRTLMMGIGGYCSILKKSQGTFTEYINGQIKINTISNTLYGYNKYDYGLTLSFTYSIKFLKKELLLVQLIDKLGLANINIPQPHPIVEKNHVVFLMMGLTINK